MKRNLLTGFGLAIVSAVAYGANGLFAKPLYKLGLSPNTVLLLRYLAAAILLGLFMVCARRPFALRRNEILPTLLGGVLFSFSSTFLFLSYKPLGIGVASTILFVYPVMVAALMLFFHERPTWQNCIGIALALAGVAVLCLGDGCGESTATGAERARGIVYSVLSAFFYAVYMVMVRTTPMKSMPADRITFYNLSAGFLLFVGIALFTRRLEWGWTSSPFGIAYVAGIAIIPTIFALATMAVAIQILGPTPAAVLGALEPVTSVVFGCILFHEPFSKAFALGIVLIVAAVTLTVLAPSRPATPDRTRG